MEKVPYMLVLGENEAANGTVAVRKRGEGDLGSLSVEEFVARISQDIRERK